MVQRHCKTNPVLWLNLGAQARRPAKLKTQAKLPPQSLNQLKILRLTGVQASSILFGMDWEGLSKYILLIHCIQPIVQNSEVHNRLKAMATELLQELDGDEPKVSAALSDDYMNHDDDDDEVAVHNSHENCI